MYDDYTDYDDSIDDTDMTDSYADDWYEGSQSRARRGFGVDPKIWIALLVVVLIVAGGAGAYYLFRNQIDIFKSPEDTTRRFYQALNNRDFGTAATYIDPSDSITASMFTNTEDLANLVFGLLLDTAAESFDVEVPDIVMELFGDLEWEFRDMTYTPIEQSGDRATVRASGELLLTALGYKAPVPWDIIHDLIRIDGEWYLHFGF